MHAYVLITPPDTGDALNELIRSTFTEADRHEVRPGVWLIRSPLVTTTELRDQLGISVGGHLGFVVAIVSGRYSGAWQAPLVEKLQVWEGPA